jgi:hypothetical protein
VARTLELSLEQLTKLARRGAVAAVAEIETEVAQIRRAFPSLGASGKTGAARRNDRSRRRRGKLSAAGRAAIAAAQKARWAKIKKGKKASTRRRKGMSAAARKAVGERMRKYWAAKRAAKAGAKK